MNDEQIISKIKRGDESAISYAINRYSKLMWSIAGTILKNVGTDEDIEECVADVFVYLWKNPDKYDASRGKLKSWLCIVARSQAIDKYRRLAKRSFLSLDDMQLTDNIGLIDGVLREEAEYKLISAVNELAEPDKEILTRRYYYGQKPKEIAFALDIPVKQVENRLYRTKLKLRQLIDSDN